MKQKELARWLKAVVILALFVGLFLCFVYAPEMGREIANMFPEYSYMFWPTLIFIWITAVIFYIALLNLWLISNDISRDNSFSVKNAKRLRLISRLSLTEVLMYLSGMIILFLIKVAPSPGIMLLMLFIMFIGLSIAVAAAVMSHLAEKANGFKAENDLTI